MGGEARRGSVAHSRRSDRRRATLATLVTSIACLLAASLAAVSPISGASPTDPDRLAAFDTYLTEATDELGIPGLALVVVDGDRIVHQLALGKADESGRPITAQTPFHLASVSKAFTATAILQLVESGRVDLDAPVQRYLPWFTVADADQASRITVRMLLGQTSGFSELVGQRYVGWDDQDAGALERAVRGLASVSLDPEPGERFQYSNANYDILAAIVEAAGGMPYDAYVEEHIYRPLQMDHSHATREAAVADGLASGYSPWFGLLWRPTDVPTTRAAAGAATTFVSAEDLGHWLIAQLNDGRFGEASVLSEVMTALEHQPIVAQDEFHAYAMGWYVRPLWEALDVVTPDAPSGGSGYRLPELIEHGGSWANTHTYAGMVPDQDWGFALLVNGNDPRQEGRLGILEQNILRLSQGQEPIGWDDSGEDPIVRYAVVISLVLLLAELVSFGWSVRAIRGLGRPRREGVRRRRLIVGWALALALDLLVLALFIPVLADRVDFDIVRLIRSSPDTALLLVPTIALAILWGPVRTLVLGWQIVRMGRVDVPPPAGATA